MMGAAHTHDTDPYEIDPLAYLAELNGKLTIEQCVEHYEVLKPALWRLQSENPVKFEPTLKEVCRKLKLKVKTVKTDLAKLAIPPLAKTTRQFLDKMGQNRPLRLAQDFVDGKLWFGVIADGDKRLLNSDRDLVSLDELPEGLTVKDRGFDLCRMSKDAIERFLNGGTATGHELLADLRQFVTRFAVFPDTRIPLLLAVWTLGTYCYQVFHYFPYLVLRSPEKRCGKTRVLNLLNLLAFNASDVMGIPTTALLFRGPSRNGGTLLLDEVETLKNSDKENFRDLVSVLNIGFQQGGSVPRMQKTASGEFKEVSFPTYCPRAFASINKLPDTIEDRSIIIVMQRKLKGEGRERFSPSRLEAEAQALRDRCYIWALTHAGELAKFYDQANLSLERYLGSLDDRARDVWEPLASIAALADADRGDPKIPLTEELTDLARALSQVRDSADDDSTVVQVIRALQEIVAQQRQSGLWQDEAEIMLAPAKLADLLKEKLGWERLNTKGLAGQLNPLGLSSRSTKNGAKTIRAYHLHEQTLAELSARYGQTGAEEDEKK